LRNPPHDSNRFYSTFDVTFSGHSFQVHVGTLRSRSRGEVRALSGDIRDAPRIQANAMSSQEDWIEIRNAIRIARDVIRQPAMRSFAGQEISPGTQVESDADLDKFIRQHLESAYHPCGTCRMGDVVDDNGLVGGVSGLRVADASIMPRVTAGNLNAPVIMIAEKIADAIKGVKLPAERDL
jgi:choline dehydrogenase